MATASSPKKSPAKKPTPEKPGAKKRAPKVAATKTAKTATTAMTAAATKVEAVPSSKAPAPSPSSQSQGSGDDEKAALWAALLSHMETSLAEMVSAARATHEAATHPESRPENDKDTRGVELSYLAAGQSARAMELQRAVSELRAIKLRSFVDAPIAVTALVRLRDDDTDVESLYLLAPASGGGPKLSYGGAPVAVVSPAAPLGKALVGRRTDDEFEVVLAGKKRVFAVVDVR